MSNFAEALELAKLADAVIYVGGIDGQYIEREGKVRVLKRHALDLYVTSASFFLQTLFWLESCVHTVL